MYTKQHNNETKYKVKCAFLCGCTIVWYVFLNIQVLNRIMATRQNKAGAKWTRLELIVFMNLNHLLNSHLSYWT